jgi:hypothetical protein
MAVKLRKADVEDIDAAGLDEATYSTEEYEDYEGEVPPSGIILRGYVKKMWWTRTANDDAMLKVLWIAAENDGDLEEYNGCPFWLNLALIKSVKFRWGPFFEQYGLTMQLVTTKTYVESLTDESDPNGAKVVRIDTFKPGENEDDAWCRIVTGREMYNGSPQARVKEWLDYEADEDEDEEPADEADEDEGEEYDEEAEDEEGDEEEDEDEEEPEVPSKGRGRTSPDRASGRGTARSKTASKPAAARGGTKAPARGAKPAAASKTGSRTRTAASSGRSGKTTRRGSKDNPPF